MLSLLKKIFGAGPAVDFKELTEKGAVIIDVRSTSEFRSGHIKNAVNVPLDSIRKQLQMLRKSNKPVIAVCRSGARSGMAVNILRDAGIEAYNGGAWSSLKNKLS